MNQMPNTIVLGQIGGDGMRFESQRNLLMECFDTNSKTYVVTDPKTELEHKIVSADYLNDEADYAI